MTEIDVSIEELLTVTEAAKRFPGRPHKSSVWRYVLNGVRGIKLPSVMIGGKRFTSAEAILQFIAATNSGTHGHQDNSRIQTQRQRENDIERAEIELRNELD